MFFKIIKYDLNSMYKIVFTFNIAMIVSFILSYVTEKFFYRDNFFSDLFFGIATLCVVLVTFGYFILIMYRYSKSIYGSEGYFIHTIPLNAWQIILSKIISAIILGVFTAICGAICILIVFMSGSINIFDVIYNNIEKLGPFILFMLYILSGIIVNIVKLYFIISIVNIDFLEKYKYIYGLILFYILNQFEFYIQDFLPFSKLSLYVLFSNYNNFSMLFCIGLSLVLIVIYYSATVYIVDKKLYIK